MHPAAPDDRKGLIDAFDQTVQSIIDLGFVPRRGLRSRHGLPGWTVKDQLAHVVGPEKCSPASVANRRGARLRAHQARARPRVEHDVEARRRCPAGWSSPSSPSSTRERIAQLRESQAELDTVIGGLFGPETTFGQIFDLRIIDTWCHEQDIRAALDRPGNLDSPAAALFTEAVLHALPRVAARVAGIGAAMRSSSTSPVRSSPERALGSSPARTAAPSARRFSVDTTAPTARTSST